MSRSMANKMLAGAATAAVLVFLAASQAGAGFVLDARFDDTGSSSKDLSAVAPGTTYWVNVWAQITGTGAAHEGLQYVYYSLVSSKPVGGPGDIDVIDRNLRQAVPEPPERAMGFWAVGSQPGNIADLNGDGNVDLGSTIVPWPDASDYAKPRAGSPLYSDSDNDADGITDYGQAIPNGWEWRVERVQLIVNSLPNPGQPIRFAVTPPSWMPEYEGLVSANWWEDGVFKNRNYSGDHVEFFVPEPGTIACLGIGGLALIARAARRRRA